MLVLGIFMVNAEGGYNEAAMGMSIHIWSLLFYACAILVWNVYYFKNKRVALVLQALGVAGLIYLGIIYKAGEDGSKGSHPIGGVYWALLAGLISLAVPFTNWCAVASADCYL
ncbi:hypothetical protein [Paraflavitalea speifideaquila]|uniref:hypothetical protein n=1 Tax=Paraflavitalea speifideaquila TaxID=3076558 RepID=UPI0028E91980|nr:hypothetical protein [Paraflavitalea speifideiaquila]